jgi:DNA adenine methylase
MQPSSERLDSADSAGTLKIVNVASVTQLSPFRYPGGKTWLVPYVLNWLKGLPFRPETLVDPFLGGGSVPLSALQEGVVDQLVLREIDEEVAAVWNCVFGASNERLCKKILTFRISRSAIIRELDSGSRSMLDAAFRTILKNRTFRGGILAKGASLMKAGENGRGVASRWYPETLAGRIRRISELSGAIDFDQGDGFEVIRRFAKDQRAAFFIDPPYTAGNGKRAGTRLYNHNHLDHEQLFELVAGCSGQFLMTYDDDPAVVKLASRFGFFVERVPMKNTHHEEKCELAITKAPRLFS